MLFLNLLFAQVDIPAVTDTANELANSAAQLVPAVPLRAWLDMRTLILASIVLLVLAIASWVASYLTRRSSPSINPALVERFVLRLWSWWLMLQF